MKLRFLVIFISTIVCIKLAGFKIRDTTAQNANNHIGTYNGKLQFKIT